MEPEKGPVAHELKPFDSASNLNLTHTPFSVKRTAVIQQRYTKSAKQFKFNLVNDRIGSGSPGA